MTKPYAANIGILRALVESHAFITPIANHRNPDGTINEAQFKEKWEACMDTMEKIALWQHAPGYDGRDPLQREPYMVFVPSESPTPRGTIVVAHGGGFAIRTGCEGPNIALHFHDLGYNTAILTYRLRPYTRFDCLADLQRAIRILRARREELGITEKIAVMGFSAGGMLCGNAATHYDNGNPAAQDPVERFGCRPDAVVCGYGAISGLMHPRLFGYGTFDPEDMHGTTMADRVYLAPERNVTADTPPFFLWQTLSDDGRFSMHLAEALSECGVAYELHIVDGAEHGVGLADGENDLGINEPHVTHWATLCDEWLQKYGI